MKYIVITTKHHEGFCLWDSKYTNFDVGSTPFKRDILKELSNACKKNGIKFGTYYSIFDWNHPSQERNVNGKDAETPWANNKMKAGKKAEYVTYMKNQVKELVDNGLMAIGQIGGLTMMGLICIITLEG
jgi:alpha-L-fucosidase